MSKMRHRNRMRSRRTRFSAWPTDSPAPLFTFRSQVGNREALAIPAMVAERLQPGVFYRIDSTIDLGNGKATYRIYRTHQ